MPYIIVFEWPMETSCMHGHAAAAPADDDDDEHKHQLGMRIYALTHARMEPLLYNNNKIIIS